MKSSSTGIDVFMSAGVKFGKLKPFFKFKRMISENYKQFLAALHKCRINVDICVINWVNHEIVVTLINKRRQTFSSLNRDVWNCLAVFFVSWQIRLIYAYLMGVGDGITRDINFRSTIAWIVVFPIPVEYVYFLRDIFNKSTWLNQ